MLVNMCADCFSFLQFVEIVSTGGIEKQTCKGHGSDKKCTVLNWKSVDTIYTTAAKSSSEAVRARRREKVVFLKGNKRTSVHYLQCSFVMIPKASLKMISNLYGRNKNSEKNVHLPFSAHHLLFLLCAPARFALSSVEYNVYIFT